MQELAVNVSEPPVTSSVSLSTQNHSLPKKPLFLFGLLLLLLGLGTVFYFFVLRNSVRTVYITDNSPEGAGVVWLTNGPAVSYLVPDAGWKSQFTAFLPSTKRINDVVEARNRAHYARLKNLKPNTTYALHIVVNGIVRDRVVVTTAPILRNIPTPIPLLAEAFDTNKKPLQHAVIMVHFVSRATGARSTLLAARVNEEGKFAIDLSTIRSSDLTSSHKYNSGQDLLSISAVTNTGVKTLSLKLEDAFVTHKFQFPTETRGNTSLLIGRATAAQNCQQVCEMRQVCGPTCRSCAGASEENQIPGCGEDGSDANHPDICDGPEHCEEDQQCHEECTDVPEAAPPPAAETPPSHVEEIPQDADVDGGMEEEDGSTFDPAVGGAEPSETSLLAQGLPTGDAGVEFVQPLAQLTPTPQLVETPTPTLEPFPLASPTPPLTAAPIQKVTGVSVGAEPRGANTYEVVGSVRGDSAGADLQWHVEFGDGTSSSYTSKDPLRMPHAYTKTGIYTITVTVTDSTGKSFNNRVAVSVEGQPSPAKPVNSLTAVTPPPTTPKSSEDHVAVDLNRQEIIQTVQGVRVISNALALLQAVEGKPVSSGIVSILYANRTKVKAVVIKDGKITETFDVDPATRKRISAKKPRYLASSASSAVLGVSTEQNTVEATQLTNGQLAISIPEGEVEVTVEGGEGEVATAKGLLKAGEVYQIKPNLEGREGEIKLSGGNVFLEEGWNLIALNVAPKKDYMAEDLLNEMNAQGGEAIAVNRWINNKWQTHVVGNFGTNFKIEVGHGYFVYARKPSTWLVPANNDVVKPDVLIDPGWNLLATTNLSIAKASELLHHINSNSTPPVNADTVTQYVNNLWQSIKVKDNTVFGKDFEVTNRRSYFIKAQNQGIWRSK